MLSAFPRYANYHFTVNNEGGISKNKIFRNFVLRFQNDLNFSQIFFPKFLV